MAVANHMFSAIAPSSSRKLSGGIGWIKFDRFISIVSAIILATQHPISSNLLERRSRIHRCALNRKQRDRTPVRWQWGHFQANRQSWDLASVLAWPMFWHSAPFHLVHSSPKKALAFYTAFRIFFSSKARPSSLSGHAKGFTTLIFGQMQQAESKNSFPFPSDAANKVLPMSG